MKLAHVDYRGAEVSLSSPPPAGSIQVYHQRALEERPYAGVLDPGTGYVYLSLGEAFVDYSPHPPWSYAHRWSRAVHEHRLWMDAALVPARQSGRVPAAENWPGGALVDLSRPEVWEAWAEATEASLARIGDRPAGILLDHVYWDWGWWGDGGRSAVPQFPDLAEDRLRHGLSWISGRLGLPVMVNSKDIRPWPAVLGLMLEDATLRSPEQLARILQRHDPQVAILHVSLDRGTRETEAAMAAALILDVHVEISHQVSVHDGTEVPDLPTSLAWFASPGVTRGSQVVVGADGSVSVAFAAGAGEIRHLTVAADWTWRVNA